MQTQVSSAGHPGPLIHRKFDQAVYQCSNSRGMPLGILAEADYDTETVPLKPGDTLLLSTDGIIEAFNPAYGQYGLERLKHN